MAQADNLDIELTRLGGRLDLLVQSVTDYAIYMLDCRGVVASWNVGAQRLKGYAPEEIIGEHFSRFYTPEAIEEGKPLQALATALKDDHFEAEDWRVRKDGSRFWANVVIHPIRTSSGDLIGYAKITRDLTERRLAQLALERSQESFFHSQKMEAIGQLTGGVAHDFNNLLSAIIGSLELAERRAASGADITRFLHNARQAAERGATLTQRMLAFARKQELTMSSVDLNRTVHDMADLLARTLGAETQVETRFPLVLPPAHADVAQLELALLNLAVNARDAMPGGGRILISARAACGDGEVVPAGHYVVLSVADHGEGMDAETLRRATEPFYTTKGVGRGTGLGLPMVLGMAEQCGGRLILNSVPGEGTTAELWLQVARGCAAASPETEFAKDIGRPLDILVVDDDLIVLMNAVAMLEDMGHRVYEAATGKAALDLLRKHPVDLLMTDYAMPGMNGMDLIDAAMTLRPQLKVAVISGYADLPEGVELAVPRLAKPYDDADLRNLVASIVGKCPDARQRAMVGR